MFTGIITHLGHVMERTPEQLKVSLPEGLQLEIGSSLAVNGTCLTATQLEADTMVADVSPETWRRTMLGGLKSGDVVNLEQPSKIGDTLDGHYVLGHVDTVGEVVAIEPEADSYLFTFRVDASEDRYLVEKGSIALDGISLTIFNVDQGQFTVAIIPHTYEHTNLHKKQPGDAVNIEFDVLGKYTEKLLNAHLSAIRGKDAIRNH